MGVVGSSSGVSSGLSCDLAVGECSVLSSGVHAYMHVMIQRVLCRLSYQFGVVRVVGVDVSITVSMLTTIGVANGLPERSLLCHRLLTERRIGCDIH